MKPFEPGTVTVFPTDTAFGMGARIDDPFAMQEIYRLKQRDTSKPLSLMLRDFQMLERYAYVPKSITATWFSESPKTIILAPKPILPKSFAYPEKAVAFRVNTLSALTPFLEVPITATSTNLSGEPPIYSIAAAKAVFGDRVAYFDLIPELPIIPPSEIWDYTKTKPIRIR